MQKRYGYWNNKGGTGKTSLCFQSVTGYAETHPNERILTIDVCPQANLSELLLGGLNNNGSDKLLVEQGKVPRCSIGGYFQLRLPSRSEEHTSELPSLMRISYDVFCFKKKNRTLKDRQ